MTASSLRLLSVLATVSVLFLNGCSSGLGGCGDSRFVLTPTDGSPYTETVEACSHSPATGDCHLEIFDVSGENQYIQFSPFGINSSCEGAFEARFKDGGTEYDLYGDILRAFGTNTSEPFATGSYSTSGGETGSFLFYEDELAEL